MMREYYVYILTNVSRTLYIGVTNDLQRRICEHRSGIGSDFTRKYHVHQLVYYESTNSVWVAIEREKELKSWRRSLKIALIEQKNPDWNDLAAEWQDPLSSVMP
jgi:putative endonuclease